MKPAEELTVLVVDDEADLREAIAFDFRRRGFSALAAGSGREAMKLIENNKIDLIVSDINMPNGNGIELLDWAKDRQPSLPIFMFLGSNIAPCLTPEEAYGKGAEAVFSKPFDRKELHAAAVHVLLPLNARLKGCLPRPELAAPAGVKFLESNFSIHTKTVDIGRGGMFVELNEQFPKISEEADFQVKAAKGNFDLKGSGTVRWVRRQNTDEGLAGCGIEFTCLDSNSVTALSKFLDNWKTKSFIPN